MKVSKKILILGHFGVGKTSLIQRFVKNSFSEDYKVSIGVHISKKEVTVLEKSNVSLILWDIEGTDDMANLRDSYLLGTHGIIYVFDILRRSTIKNIDSSIAYLSKKIPNTPILIVANKSDMVDVDTTKKIFQDKNIPYNFMVSAKTGEEVERLFVEMATILNSHV